MTYKALMIHIDLAGGSEAALRVTCDLADRFAARTIGVTSGCPTAPVHAEGMVATSILEADFVQFKNALTDCEKRFRTAFLTSKNPVEWRVGTAIPADFLATEARAADLVVVNRGGQSLVGPPGQRLDIGDAVMTVGRPILVVPPGKSCLPLNRILIAWKDAVEARRAVSAALPLLKQAQDIMLVELIADSEDRSHADQRLCDVTNWLKRHDITASTCAEISADDAGSQLDLIATQNGIDIIVAGAYGHSRLQEWIFGGATQYLLHRATVCTLMVH